MPERSTNGEYRDSPRYRSAIALFDEANAEDPNREQLDGTSMAKELVYARRMTARLDEFVPDASESLSLAVRCQHIRRWTTPRTDYPPGRSGYRRWRSSLARFHAHTAGVLLERVHYDADLVARVRALVRKEHVSRDPEAQTLEDVACMVFLEHYAARFAAEHPEDKVTSILGKTWQKMSPGAQAAVATLPIPQAVTRLLSRVHRSAD